MPDEQWLHVPEHGAVYEIDPFTGEPVAHHLVAVASARHGSRIARLPALERLVRGYVEGHDQDCEFRGMPSCGCDLCTEGRGLLGMLGTAATPQEEP